ncbi:hypothetical protein CYY_005102 [Polysphondylium violaceum]|uniref:Glycosyltransferase 2-like domain-containing protein n=1 Tax=Polysphondylium violaceum TaxID=133409 RepID=A0A8J4PU20_9MYCE|nr:hypothetical protein CYY_005102 [Polysphondylium violaceum]
MVQLSVVLPVYVKDKSNSNVVIEYLQQSANSIINQSFLDWELIIINDGSWDDDNCSLKSLLQSYQEQDKRIKIITHLENKGLVYCLNDAIINHSKGNYIARMDCDDISNPNRFHLQYQYLESNLNIGVVGCPVKVFNDNSSETIEQLFNNENSSNSNRIIQHPDKDLANWSMIFNCCLVHPSVMMRRSVFRKYSSKYPHIEDYSLWLKLITKYKVNVSNIQLPKPLLLLRKHQHSISSQYLDIQKKSSIQSSCHYLKKLLMDQLNNNSSTNAIEQLVKEDIMEILLFPSVISKSIEKVEEIPKCIQLLEVIEEAFSKIESFTLSRDILKESTNERIGELVSICMSSYPNHPTSLSVWTKWLSRNPTSQLVSLLSSSNPSMLFKQSPTTATTPKLVNRNLNKNGIRVVVFSKDRAFQLNQYLRTFYKYSVKDKENQFIIDMVVIYTYSEAKYQQSYQSVIDRYTTNDSNSNILFIKEENFTQELQVYAIQQNPYHYIMFAVDDIIYYNDFNLGVYAKELENNPDCLGFYLKMNSYITYCHTCDESISVPIDRVVITTNANDINNNSNNKSNGIMKWDRSKPDCKRDWNYPFDLCSTIYKTEQVDLILKNIIKYYGIKTGISHPNRLEFNGNRVIIQKQSYIHLPYCLSPTEPIMSVVTINRVQDVNDNPFYTANDQDNNTLTLDQLDQLLFNTDFNDQQYSKQLFNSVHIGDVYFI